MKPLARLAVFAAAAVTSLGVGAALGAAVGPSTDPSPGPVHPVHEEQAPPSTTLEPTATVPTDAHDHTTGTNP